MGHKKRLIFFKVKMLIAYETYVLTISKGNIERVFSMW